MSSDLPTKDEVQPGVTVRVVQEKENNPGEPLVGEVLKVLTQEHTHPKGIRVKLESGVVGRVKEVTPDVE